MVCYSVNGELFSTSHYVLRLLTFYITIACVAGMYELSDFEEAARKVVFFILADEQYCAPTRPSSVCECDSWNNAIGCLM